MRFWTREILGWALLILGLGLFSVCLLFLRSRQVVEAGVLAGVAVVIFRSGVHFLKVAVAARLFVESRQSPVAGRRPPVGSS
jgi:hypothetical protein